MTRLMYSYQYKLGDRPLEGYTIQRAAGRGGFGEVYYATSDSGKEVALKVVTGYEQIELRGISQCMNLKSPHLVTIFDVKYGAQGRPFVIMEYVAGPSLRELLDQSPAGLGEQKAAFFLREIGKGLTYLHDGGIVHRDLKPGNIFFENGYVKIGDYGLSKAISTSQHSGQTVTVGTVHYMAPEIGMGKYDRGIDIYALGAVLYEMLTGVPPFVGASPSEVLMKHLSAEPDCSHINEPFKTVISRAMSKDPARRYQSVQEMVEAVFGAAHIQQSVSVFSPAELSMVAERVAAGVGGGGGGAGGSSVATPGPRTRVDRFGERMQEVGQRLEAAGKRIETRMRERFADRRGATTADPSRDMTVPIADTLPAPMRVALVMVIAAVMGAAAGVLGAYPWLAVLPIFLGVVGATGGMAVYRTVFEPSLVNDSRGTRRLLCSASVIIGLLLGGGWMLAGTRMHAHTWIAIIGPLLVAEFDKWTRSNRLERINLGAAIGMGAFAFGLCMAFGGDPEIAIAMVAGVMLAVQAMAPWDPRASAAVGTPAPAAAALYGNVNVSREEAEAMRAAGVKVYGNLNVTDDKASSPAPTLASNGRVVFDGVRFLWLALAGLTFAAAIAFWVGAGKSTRISDRSEMTCMGFFAIALTVFSVTRAVTRQYFGVWNYLLRPLIVIAGPATVVILGIVLGNSNRLSSDEIAMATFVMIAALFLSVTACFFPGRKYVKSQRTPAAPVVPPAAQIPASPYHSIPAFLALMGIFACLGGLQRIYVGKYRSGLLWLLTGGLFGVGQLVDAIMILNGTFTDKDGLPLRNWEQSMFTQAPPVAVTPSMTPSRVVVARKQNYFHALLIAVAMALFAAATVVGIFIAVNVPAAAAAGVFDERTARELLQQFNGYTGWPELVFKVGTLLVGLLMIAATLIAIFVRRAMGAAHVCRAVVAAALLALSVGLLAQACGTVRWELIAPLAQTHKIPEAMDLFMDQCRSGAAGFAMLWFIVANLLFAWPARQMNAADASKAGVV